MDMVKRDRFELLSAYLDGEVTADERKQVEAWLATDASVRCLYVRLLKLRQGLRTLPVPEDQQLPKVKVQQIFTRLNRRSHLALVFSGATAAAFVISLGYNFLPGSESRTVELAERAKVESTPTTSDVVVPVSPLMVGLNSPVIEIPKAAIAPQKKPVNQSTPKQLDDSQDIN
jgi:predicted anti-sigma-YlaC factor YlaD